MCVRVLVFVFCHIFCFVFRWISKSCVLISIILIMRSLTCQHTFVAPVICCTRTKAPATLRLHNSAYMNERMNAFAMEFSFYFFFAPHIGVDSLLFVLCMRIFTEKCALCTSPLSQTHAIGPNCRRVAICCALKMIRNDKRERAKNVHF